MKLGELKKAIEQAELACDDADECEISVVDANDNEYDIGTVDDEEGERLYIFVEQTDDED